MRPRQAPTPVKAKACTEISEGHYPHCYMSSRALFSPLQALVHLFKNKGKSDYQKLHKFVPIAELVMSITSDHLDLPILSSF
ncbi:hypothetical protein E5288_WYG019239 [Bos mutus]|uniref:Uncharacterized protein n=1 Tax=Bos mutus TaxID=72004 RepID=A0A6B0RXV0_9CETA|nr:hypothetical protein [Bos mutus]